MLDDPVGDLQGICGRSVLQVNYQSCHLESSRPKRASLKSVRFCSGVFHGRVPLRVDPEVLATVGDVRYQSTIWIGAISGRLAATVIRQPIRQMLGGYKEIEGSVVSVDAGCFRCPKAGEIALKLFEQVLRCP